MQQVKINLFSQRTLILNDLNLIFFVQDPRDFQMSEIYRNLTLQTKFSN